MGDDGRIATDMVVGGSEEGERVGRGGDIKASMTLETPLPSP